MACPVCSEHAERIFAKAFALVSHSAAQPAQSAPAALADASVVAHIAEQDPDVTFSAHAAPAAPRDDPPPGQARDSRGRPRPPMVIMTKRHTPQKIRDEDFTDLREYCANDPDFNLVSDEYPFDIHCNLCHPNREHKVFQGHFTLRHNASDCFCLPDLVTLSISFLTAHHKGTDIL